MTAEIMVLAHYRRFFRETGLETEAKAMQLRHICYAASTRIIEKFTLMLEIDRVWSQTLVPRGVKHEQYCENALRGHSIMNFGAYIRGTAPQTDFAALTGTSNGLLPSTILCDLKLTMASLGWKGRRYV